MTGSCHLIECGDCRILVNCGLFQGSRAIEVENQRPFGFRAADIDYLLLTHAHLDHCGRLPLLSRRGFRGEIITTVASRALARLVLMDAVGLREEEARYQTRSSARCGKAREVMQPLYTTLDALNCLSTISGAGRSTELPSIWPRGFG